MVFASIQVTYMLIHFSIRPMKETKDQILEMVNELIYLALIIILFFRPENDKWPKLKTNVFIWIMEANTVIFLTVSTSESTWFKIIVFLFFTIYKKMKNYQKHKGKLILLLFRSKCNSYTPQNTQTRWNPIPARVSDPTNFSHSNININKLEQSSQIIEEVKGKAKLTLQNPKLHKSAWTMS